MASSCKQPKNMTKILLYPLETNPILQMSLLSTDLLHQQLKMLGKKPVITKKESLQPRGGTPFLGLSPRQCHLPQTFPLGGSANPLLAPRYRLRTHRNILQLNWHLVNWWHGRVPNCRNGWVASKLVHTEVYRSEQFKIGVWFCSFVS